MHCHQKEPVWGVSLSICAYEVTHNFCLLHANPAHTVRYFDEWVDKERLVKHGPLHFLKNSVIGIDAAYFLKQFIYESVLTALGGSPIALEAIANAVKNLQDAGIGLHFVFNGLQYGKMEDPLAKSTFINSQNHAAFTRYEGGQPEMAKRDFKLLGVLCSCWELTRNLLTQTSRTQIRRIFRNSEDGSSQAWHSFHCCALQCISPGINAFSVKILSFANRHLASVL